MARDVVADLRNRQDKYERLIEKGEWNPPMSLPVSTEDLRDLLAVVEAAKELLDKYPQNCGHKSWKDGCSVCSFERALARLYAGSSGETE